MLKRFVSKPYEDIVRMVQREIMKNPNVYARDAFHQMLATGGIINLNGAQMLIPTFGQTGHTTYGFKRKERLSVIKLLPKSNELVVVSIQDKRLPGKIVSIWGSERVNGVVSVLRDSMPDNHLVRFCLGFNNGKIPLDDMLSK